MKKSLIILFAAYSACLSMSVCAEEEPVFSLNSWVSSGQTTWRHDSQHPLFGVPTSELDYKNVDSTVAEVGIFQKLQSGHSLRFTLGTGSISEGTLVDDDYLSASGAVSYGATQSDAHRFSRTESDIDGGGLFYLKGEFLPKGLKYNSDRVDLQLSLGLHYWQEEYVATGLTQIECTASSLCYPAGTILYTGTTVITNTVEWTGLGIGIDYLLNITEGLVFQLDFTFYPIMSLVNEDIHHLRGDLAQDPSIKMTGNGMGYDMLAAFKLQFTRNFSAQLGYRLWDRWVENQTITFYGSDGTSSTANLMDFSTRREGILGGITYEF